MPKKDIKNNIIQQGQVYGYLRVSTEEQKLDNNKLAIQQFKDKKNLIGPIQWIEEKVSGTIHWKERELGKWLDNSKKYDVLIVSELSRISRTTIEIYEFISNAVQKNVTLYSLDVPMTLDNSSQAASFILGISLCAQFERENISVRTKRALEKRKADGQILGRPIGAKNKFGKKLDPHKDKIKDLISKGVKLKQIAFDYKVNKDTLTRFVKENNLK